MNVDQQFTAFYEKLQSLLRQYTRLERENDKLRAELEEWRTKEGLALAKVDELQQQISILKFAAGDMTDKDKKTFERKLNQYIKEIDRTIGYLSE
jgi:predicted RNase H-like nuclease (RuvC/YqgF family)